MFLFEDVVAFSSLFCCKKRSCSNGDFWSIAKGENERFHPEVPHPALQSGVLRMGVTDDMLQKFN